MEDGFDAQKVEVKLKTLHKRVLNDLVEVFVFGVDFLPRSPKEVFDPGG